MIQAQMWFGATGKAKKVSTIMNVGGGEKLQTLQNYSHGSRRYVNRDDTPLIHRKGARPIGQKAAKAKKAGNSSNNISKFLEEIARQNQTRIKMEQKRQENEMAIRAEYAQEREYLHKKEICKTDRETMAMDTSHISNS
ncbi:hypothetical protein Prudu_001674 [Prunus dulcis]|uniref:Uncharacterized protein n=1 Tax=Prunus dulcis TaxID=3755 RepID=A0A4Y1QP78_PRUDU|nr:hypothetical protein Prudu_001674 [Prunus dulcis]